ncbi:hypothetical protein LUZ61_007797 [Rhynchospora tenuis]|uniref:Retrotransposon Copia-like N-terminal domain-containing protein n=1 Tax=Rhynchospora tenuis TaxID=198213 RepID=A0AAD5ZUC4_9POAL|nr:hypothetical protein LUZ61_007797 [Rhynchospora tenuis]
MASAIPDSSSQLNNGGLNPSPPSDTGLPSSSSALSSQPNPISIINISISTKLNKQNFLTWKSQIFPIIHGYNLFQFINSQPPSPSVINSSGQVQFNPEYLPWVRQDQLLLGWMRASLTEQVQAQVISCSTSAELWNTLQKHFSSSS